jgi:thiol-disulfide isomerase/thioredoxin
MKKVLLLVCGFCFTQTSQAQLNETFDNQAAFDSWTLITDFNSYNWEFADYSTAQVPSDGGVATSSAPFSLIDKYLISPPVDLTSISGTILLEWDVLAQDPDPNWPEEKYSVIIATGNDQAAMDAGTIVFSETIEAYSVYVTREVNLSAFAGQTIYVAFFHEVNQDILNIDNVKVYPNSKIDAKIQAIKAPNEQNCKLTNNENITLTITNEGGDPISNFNIGYSVDNGTEVIETITQSIAYSNSIDYTFNTPADISTKGEHLIRGKVYLPGDENSFNNSLIKFVTNSDSDIEIIVGTAGFYYQYWTITDNSNNNVIEYHSSPANVSDTLRVCLLNDECYTFEYFGARRGDSLKVIYNGNEIFYESDWDEKAPLNVKLPAIGSGCPAIEYEATELTMRTLVSPGTHDVTFELTNYGYETITKVDFDYVIDNGSPVNSVLTGLDITSGEIFELTATTPANLPTFDLYSVLITVNSANDVTNEDISNDTTSNTVKASDIVPKKMVFFEDGTGSWCGWCPRGSVALWNLENKYPESSFGIAVHNRDQMVDSIYDDGLSEIIFGLPGGSVDRGRHVDPGDFEDVYHTRKDMMPPVALEATWTFNETSRNLHVEISADFIANLSGDYRFNAVVKEDGVTGGFGYHQSNYYSYEARNIPLVGAGFDWQKEKQSVPASVMVHDHVARAILGGFNGTENSLPNTINERSHHTFSYDYIVPTFVDINNVQVAVMVHGPSDSEIINTARADFSTSINTMNQIITDFDIVPNPANEVLNLRIDIKKDVLVTITLADITGKVIFNNQSSLHAGSYVEQIDTRDIENGLYLINLNVDGQMITERVVISH